MAGKLPCTYCKKNIDASASRCPYCQGEYAPDQVAKRKKQGNQSLAAGCLVLVVLAAAIGMCSKSDDEGAATAAPKAVAGKPLGDVKADTIAFTKEVMGLLRECDGAAKTISVAIKSGDPVRAYRAADQTETACLSVSSDIEAVKIPASLSAEERKSVSGILKACENTYIAKWDGARKLKTVLDGDARPSVLAGVQDAAAMVESGTFICAGGLAALPMSHGAKAEELGFEKGGS